jgi:hypothetical protein
MFKSEFKNDTTVSIDKIKSEQILLKFKNFKRQINNSHTFLTNNKNYISCLNILKIRFNNKKLGQLI